MMSRKLPSVLQSDRGSLGLEAVLKQIREILSEIPSSEDDFEEDKINASLDHVDTMIAAIDRGDGFVDVSSTPATEYYIVMSVHTDYIFNDETQKDLPVCINTPITVFTGQDARTKAEEFCKGKDNFKFMCVL